MPDAERLPNSYERAGHDYQYLLRSRLTLVTVTLARMTVTLAWFLFIYLLFELID